MANGKGIGDFAKGLIDTATGGLVNSIGQFIGNVQSFNNQKKLAKYTSQLQQDAWNRQFAMMNARQDQLNAMSASVMKNSLANAGLSASGDNNFAEFSSNPAQGSGISPSLGSGTGANVFGDFQGALSANRLADAQADLLRAQEKKVKSETVGQNFLNQVYKSNADYAAALNDMQLKVGNSTYDLNISKKNLTDADTDLSRIKHNEVAQKIDESKKLVEKYDAEILQGAFNCLLNEKQYNEVVRHNKALEGISYKQMLAYASVCGAEVGFLDAQKQYTLSQKKGQDIRNGIDEYCKGYSILERKNSAFSSQYSPEQAAANLKSTKVNCSFTEYMQMQNENYEALDAIGKFLPAYSAFRSDDVVTDTHSYVSASGDFYSRKRVHRE